MRIPFLLLPALLPLLTAGAPGPESTPTAPDKELASMLAAYEATELGRVEAYEAFRPRFEAFASAHRGTEPEVRATLWLVQNSWWLRSDGKMESTSLPLAKGLLKRHAESPQLGLIVEYQYVFAKSAKAPLFEELYDTTPHRDVKAAAQFGLARLGPARLEGGQPNPHFALLVDDFAEVPWRATTFGAIADAYLNPLSPDDLAVGNPAPEIIGVDETGAPMKLSDFRGRVVLLDFWGDW